MTENEKTVLLPAGLADALPPDAEHEARVVEVLMARFAGHGYERVKPPLIEFEESLLAGHGRSLTAQLFRLMDPVSQRMMGVRTDITLQVSRIAASRLKRAARPLRLSYAGQVLRVRGTQLRPERQFGQAGVELIGSQSLEAEVEVIMLAADSLATLGVKNLSVDLTLPILVPAMCRAQGLDEDASSAVRRALDQKDAAALDAVLGDGDGGGLRRLLRLAGPADDAVNQLKALPLDREAAAMVAELSELVARIRQAVPDLMLTVDPGESRGFEYQTGVSFTLLARGVRGELGRGGRYDTGAGETAVGFTLYLDSLMRALPPPAKSKRVFLPVEHAAEGARLRAEGWRTVGGLESCDDVEAQAQRLGCTHIFLSGSVQPLG
jgi:ATP phosphoribosyltransferase regulatory subunit